MWTTELYIDCEMSQCSCCCCCCYFQKKEAWHFIFWDLHRRRSASRGCSWPARACGHTRRGGRRCQQFVAYSEWHYTRHGEFELCNTDTQFVDISHLRRVHEGIENALHWKLYSRHTGRFSQSINQYSLIKMVYRMQPRTMIDWLIDLFISHASNVHASSG